MDGRWENGRNGRIRRKEGFLVWKDRRKRDMENRRDTMEEEVRD